MSPELTGLLSKRIMSARIVWLGLTIAGCMYVFVAFRIPPQPGHESSDLATAFMSPIAQALAAMALFASIAQFFIAKIMMPSTAKIKMPENLGENMRTMMGKNGRVWSDSDVATAVKLSPDEARILYCFQSWFVTLIVRLALSEAVVIFGLVLAVTQGPPVVIVPFVAVGLILFALRFPTLDAYVRQVDSGTKVI